MSHFEIVRTDAEQPWHARFVASNGRIVWTTEQYTRRRGAENAIRALEMTRFGAEVRTTDERA